MYFSQDTEDAIIRYNASTDYVERNRIYEEHISKPFQKLAENIINTFKFTYFDDSFENVKQDVVSFMVEKIGQYKSTRGKAFSYFSIVAKNFLILINNTNYKKLKIHDTVDVMDLNRNTYAEGKEESGISENREFITMMIDFWDNNITTVFKKERDIQIANAIVELFRRIDYIENFNKKALYIYIREITNCNRAQQITHVINVMRDYYGRMVYAYHEEGAITTDNIYKNKFF